MTQAEKRKIRYATLVNAGLTPTQARSWRSRSDQNIKDFYGIEIPKKQPKLKSYTTETKYKKQLEIKKYQYAREKGANYKTATEIKTKSYSYIETKVRYVTPVQPTKRIKSKQERRDERLEEWSEFSKSGKYPRTIKNVAERINKEQGFDVNASYGYGIAFYSFIEGEDPEIWVKRIEADRFTQSIRYSTMTKR